MIRVRPRPSRERSEDHGVIGERRRDDAEQGVDRGFVAGRSVYRVQVAKADRRRTSR